MTPCINSGGVSIKVPEVIADDSTPLQSEKAVPKVVVFPKIVLEQVHLAPGGKRGEPPEIYSPQLQFDIGWNVGLIEFAIPRDIIVLGIIRISLCHRAVTPISIDIGVIHV